MGKRTSVATLRGLLATALLTVGCIESFDPERRGPGVPAFQAAAQGITLDQFNGALRQTGDRLMKGFNPTNPHVGDAIIATFFWTGASTSANIITRVHDHLANSAQTPVGNNYQFVEYVSAGGISMATYVATNVQNFPDPNPTQDEVLVVEADLSEPVTDGGVKITAWKGVGATQALDRHSSASGSGSSTTIADAGAIDLGAGDLAFSQTMANDVVPLAGPSGFTRIGEGSNDFLKEDAAYLVATSASTVEPQWTWFFDRQSTWLATVLALTPASPPPGNLTVKTSTTGSNLDPDGYTVTVDGSQSQPIATNDPTGVTFTDLAPGSHNVVLSGVATNCSVSGGNSRMVTVVSGETVTTTFSVTCTTPPGNLRVTTSTTGSSLDPDGYTVTVDGSQSQHIATNDPTGVTFTNLAAGNHSVVLSGVATNCSVSGGNSRMVTVVSGQTVTTTFSVTCTTPTTSVNDFMTGGGKLQNGREFVTFGFVARPTGGDFEWVQHCPNGANPASAACKAGQFTFHGTVTPGTYAGRDGFPKCRTWSGTGSTKSGTQSFTVNMKCDNGEPGRGNDFVDINIDINGYHSSGFLTGGNLQLHKSRS